MKKSLIALSVLAVSGTALAQSNVQIYGRVDLGLTKQNSGTTTLPGGTSQTGAAATQWEMREASGSRLGFRGTEDLGGGMKASFVIEHRFTADTGAATSTSTFWRGRSFVQLSSGLGSIYLGREYAPAESVGKAGDPFGWDTVARLGREISWAGYGSSDSERHNNALGYRSPTIGGFSAQVAVAAREGAASGRAAGFNVEYKAGPVYAGIGYDNRVTTTENEMMVLSAGYDFGLLRLVGSYTDAKVSNEDRKSASLGLTAPLGNGRLRAVIGRLDRDTAGADLTKLGLGYEHLLSKRTSLYADLGSAKGQGDLTRTNAIDFGVRHNF